MDQIQAMRVFVRVVEAGNFTRAADSLDLPKGTVTKQISWRMDLQIFLDEAPNTTCFLFWDRHRTIKKT